MPIDSQADVHVDQVISNLVLDYGRADFIGNKIRKVPNITALVGNILSDGRGFEKTS